jgi:hypothetical protein
LQFHVFAIKHAEKAAQEGCQERCPFLVSLTFIFGLKKPTASTLAPLQVQVLSREHAGKAAQEGCPFLMFFAFTGGPIRLTPSTLPFHPPLRFQVLATKHAGEAAQEGCPFLILSYLD